MAKQGEVIQSLTTIESRKLANIEQRIEDAATVARDCWKLIGDALRELRTDKQLLRYVVSTYETIEKYGKQRFNIQASRGRQYLGAAEVADNIKALPLVTVATERQLRELVALPKPQQQATVWSKAVEQSDPKPPPAKLIAEIRDSLYPGVVTGTKPKGKKTEPPPAKTDTDGSTEAAGEESIYTLEVYAGKWVEAFREFWQVCPDAARIVITELISEPIEKPKRTEAVGFDEFWNVYPKKGKVSRAKTEKAFRAAAKKAQPSLIVERAKVYSECPLVKGGAVKHATTWLNGEHWTDDDEVWNTTIKGKDNAKPTAHVGPGQRYRESD